VNRKETKRYVDTVETSRITGRAAGTLANDRTYRRGIPYVKVGKRVLYDLDDVYEFMERHKIRPD
jgi:hypothetical protein